MKTGSANGATLLTAAQVAARFQVPKSQIYRLARDGRLPVVELGRYKRFSLAKIEEFESTGGLGVKQ